ncbi:DUF3095 domain-containing protein [Lichenifustis flavocetrariae]|uniref:DUF3095 domain-containing protein n=1 Tax=Lichenifustis flavocetrariae TaxID=2949735 RepID=A0AA42CLM6_9HYPH|nr:DUF3095 domain-containing protein [Lichenifustis flavocetrariae]MCW6510576.1 DUF3095 domain-containing protein [Lichenifustis flavocetrariae]
MNDFYASLPTFTAFERIVDADAYRALPADWVIGIADVVSSTAAVAQGRYKAVNTAGAAVVSAVANALKTLDFAYVFTGDGMACAVAPSLEGNLRLALGATVGWVGAALSLELRSAVVTVAQIREAGHDVRVARFKPSPHVTYAMFSGGGLAWAEAALKSGALPQVERYDNKHPDLSGLSCRFKPIPAQEGVMLSLIVTPRGTGADASFRELVNDLLTMIGAGAGRPVPIEGPNWGWPPDGLDAEARLQRRPGQSLLMSRITVGLRTLAAAVIVNLGRPVGGFSPKRYRAQIGENSDFRKFEDGLMMTVDCSPALSDSIEARLTEARGQGFIEFGIHRQDSALLTCIVPSPSLPGHIHFVDGAGGGYTMAAQNLKQARIRGQTMAQSELSGALG